MSEKMFGRTSDETTIFIGAYMIKPIPDWPHYFADKFGNIFSEKTNAVNGALRSKPKLMTQTTNWRGYKMVNFTIKGKTFNKAVHLLILRTFVSERPKGMLGCHGKMGISINSVNNIYWATPSQNNKEDKYRDNTISRGEKQGAHKLTKIQVVEIRNKYSYRGKNGLNLYQLASLYSVHPTTIHSIIIRENWKHV